MMADSVKRSISMPSHTHELVGGYALKHRLTFSAAVTELCMIGLSMDADEPIAPRVREIVESEGEYLLHRIDDRMGYMLDAIHEDVKRIIDEVNEDDDEDY